MTNFRVIHFVPITYQNKKFYKILYDVYEMPLKELKAKKERKNSEI